MGLVIKSGALCCSCGSPPPPPPPTPCPACFDASLPTSVTVSGLDGVIVNCGGTFPWTTAACHTNCNDGTSPLYPTWNGVMDTKVCDDPDSEGNAPSYQSSSLTSTHIIHFTDGSCCQVEDNCELHCEPIDDGNGVAGWEFLITLGGACNGSNAANAVYVKDGGASPIGTYTLQSTGPGDCYDSTTGTLTYVTFPPTITIS